jgi:hypothetical protein
MEVAIPYFYSEKILVDMCKKNSYYAFCKEFNQENENKEIPEKFNFIKKFPNYFSFIQNLDNIATKQLQDKLVYKNFNINLEIRKILLYHTSLYLEEIDRIMVEEWFKLRLNTKMHSSIFFHLVETNMPKLICEYDKNILYWTILFHDSGKHLQMNPYIKEDYTGMLIDRTHPLKSVIVFINTFLKNNFIFFENEEQKKEFLNVFKNFCEIIFNSYSYEYIAFLDRNYYNMSLNKINEMDKFIIFLKEMKNNKWIYDIFVLILFHQSLPNNDYNMNKPLLPEIYIKKYFDKRLIELMRIIMVYDSCSHSLFIGGIWIKEINKHIDILRKLFN